MCASNQPMRSTDSFACPAALMQAWVESGMSIARIVKGLAICEIQGEFEDEEDFVNFDEPPKFDDDDQGFIEDAVVVFRDEDHVFTVIPMSISSQVQAVVDDAIYN
ncbi:hypothetical protein Syun_012546 [Stephania yunnanensis]|uniref:Uncharacterized protein n=1 Tax=Stephania yunnanensis TaxID=152371 RepID=A0AAP0JZU2_9MAGN